ncbi:MAG: ATP-dependent helicase HrpB, partial [Bacteroidota bacterium]
MPHRLPIETVMPELRAALRAHASVVLQAPPGAGKTTRVPLALLGEPWLRGQRILMLEPRRLAARAAARRMAQTLSEQVGDTVGYRVRRDVCTSTRTRIEVVTEGIVTRVLQSDPLLEGIGCLIFDEFHERSLAADLGLALALDVQQSLRDDLRLLVMSATLDGARIARLLAADDAPPAPVVSSTGRAFPVATHYVGSAPPRDRRPPWLALPDRVAEAVRTALAKEPGSMLAFLPGTGEIQRTETLLRASTLPAHVDIAPLYGALDQKAQDAAIAPCAPGRRKVVLATPIAETSLTIEGVRIVIDGGYARAPRFSPRSGMTSLETVRISRASAEQRRGRAGRTEPGICYRLWGRLDDQHLEPFSAPEIAEADLAPLALELAVWGVADAAVLRWLDRPRAAALSQARDLLRHLGALDAQGTATRQGRAMARLGLHPRLAHMLLSGRTLGLGSTACAVAALLGDRDPLRADGLATPDADLRLRLDVLRSRRLGPMYAGHRIDRSAVTRLRAEAEHLRRLLRVDDAPIDTEAAGLLVALAYPDRLAQGTSSANRFKLRSGMAAALSHDQLISDAPFLAVAGLDSRRGTAKIFVAAPITASEIDAHFGEEIHIVDVIRWNAEAGRVMARRQRQLEAIVLSDGPLASPDPDVVAEALLTGIRKAGVATLPWTTEARRLQGRLLFLHHARPEAWPDVSDMALTDTLDTWLRPHLMGMRRLDEVRTLHLDEVLLSRLDWSQRQALDRLAPSHLTVPSGSKRPLDYSTPSDPVLSVRLQEVFGLSDTPRILEGTVPVTLHLLS